MAGHQTIALEKILAACLLLMLFEHGAAHAEAGAAEAIKRCAANPEKDRRIACLEHELRLLAGDEASPAGVPPAPVPAPAASAAIEVEEAAPQPAQPKKPEERRSGGGDLGAEQVERRSASRSSDDPAVAATVVAIDEVGYRRLVVELDNGQIWRQTNGDRADVIRDLKNEKGFDVQLRRTGLGGYRMYIAPLDRTIRVERLK